MVRFGGFFGRLCVVVVLSLFLAEASLRVPGLILTRTEIAENKYYMLLIARMNHLWAGEKKSDPFLPPYDVFSNQGDQDPARLERIYFKTRSRVGFRSESYDFLRSESLRKKTAYEICFNNLGFRGCANHSPIKQPRTRRIIVYGSYQAFGFGLNEQANYVTRLQQLLNAPVHERGRYEVWNAGRSAGSGIVGLSQFRHDVSDYQPDLVVYDYGFVDGMIIDDNQLPFVDYFENLRGVYKWAFDAVNYLVSHSVVGYKLWVRFSYHHFYENLKSFKTVTEAFLKLSATHHVPVILLRQIMSQVPPQMYEDLQREFPEAVFVDGEKVFSAQIDVPKRRSAEESYWLNDFTENELSDLEHSNRFRYSNFRLDLWQLNEQGHDLVARALQQAIQKKKVFK